MSYFWDPVGDTFNWGFFDDFQTPLQPSPIYDPYGSGPLDYEIVSLYGAADFQIVSGTALQLVDDGTAGALIAPWPFEDVEITVSYFDDAYSDSGPELYLRWVDEDNFLLVHFTKVVGRWYIGVGPVIDGALSADFVTWDTGYTSLTGVIIRVGIAGGRLTAASGGLTGVSYLDPVSGTTRTNIHQGATKAGIGARLWPGRTSFLVMRARGKQAVAATIICTTHPPMDGPPTLTAGGDIVYAKSGKGLAQLLATTDHLRLRRRPASVGGNPDPTPALTGVLQPIAGSLEGTHGYAEGEGDEARFNYPISVRIYGNTLYVADFGNRAIRSIELDGPLPGTVTTAFTTTNMPVFAPIGPPPDPLDDRPRHLHIDGFSDKMLIVGQESLIEVAHLTSTEMATTLEVVSKSNKFGSAIIAPGGFSALVKYPIGDFTNGWHYVVLVQTSPKKPRGTVWEPGPPDVAYTCDEAGTIPPGIYLWHDGAYADDGGIVLIPNYYRGAYATLVSHNYVYPSDWGLGLVNYTGGARYSPYNACPPKPIPPDWSPMPAGQLYKSSTWETGLPERELNNGPDDVIRDNDPTAVSAVYKSEHGIIEKYSVNPELMQDQFITHVSYDHSRGLQYLPTRSVAYNFNTGIYYFTVGENPDSSAEILGWAPNRIVALDLYAPDYVTGDLELPELTVFVQRVPVPVTGTFTPGDTDTLTVAAAIDEGTVGHIPIGIRSITAGPIGLIDENGDFIVDEYGNIISF